jgi:hypothetical protein
MGTKLDIYYHWIDTSAGGLLVPDGVIHPAVSPINLKVFGKTKTKGLKHSHMTIMGNTSGVCYMITYILIQIKLCVIYVSIIGVYTQYLRYNCV